MRSRYVGAPLSVSHDLTEASRFKHGMTPDSLLDEDWNQTLERLGGAATLAMGARETKAFAWGRKIPTPTVLLRLVGAMLGDDQRRRLGEVKYLPRRVIHRHRRAQWFATPGAGLALDGPKSLPLDGARRLAGDVVGHPVDAAHLIDDAPGHTGQEADIERIDIGGHAVGRGHRA